MNKQHDIRNYTERLAEKEATAKRQQEQLEQLKTVANRLFSSPDGILYARQMIKACRMFEVEGEVSAERLQYLAAWRDFVNLFLTNLIERPVLLDILSKGKKE